MSQDVFSARVVLNVTTLEDQNDASAANGLSLRDAVLIAQSNPGREYVINLAPGTYTLTIQGNEDFRFQEQTQPNLGLFDTFVTRTGDIDITTRITMRGS